jgi:hypothetical protein
MYRPTLKVEKELVIYLLKEDWFTTNFEVDKCVYSNILFLKAGRKYFRRVSYVPFIFHNHYVKLLRL